MIIESLSLKNYRNYENLNLNFSDGTNIFYGNNAQGKTNILEAVYMSGTTKSHRTNKDLELIRFQEEESHISTILKKQGISHKIDIHLKNNKSKGTKKTLSNRAFFSISILKKSLKINGFRRFFRSVILLEIPSIFTG